MREASAFPSRISGNRWREKSVHVRLDKKLRLGYKGSHILARLIDPSCSVFIPGVIALGRGSGVHGTHAVSTQGMNRIEVSPRRRAGKGRSVAISGRAEGGLASSRAGGGCSKN